MNKNMLIKEVAVSEKLHISTAFQAVNGALRIIAQALANGDSVQIPGFGTFSVVDRQERTVNNQYTGGPTVVPAHKSVRFKPSKKIVEPLNK